MVKITLKIDYWLISAYLDFFNFVIRKKLSESLEKKLALLK